MPQHDPGDKTVQVTETDIVAAARDIGIVPGDTVMFHSSLSSMGWVVGGPDTVIDGFFEAVGPEGTVAVPTLCNWKEDEQHLVLGRWDPATTPSYVGALTEALRHRPDASRSDHPTHSVAAIGKRAAELTVDHGASGLRQGTFTDTAFAAESPWQRFRDWDAAYCFIGVTFTYNTMVHYVEALLAERAVQRLPEADRAAMAGRLTGWMKPGIYPNIRIPDREVQEQMMAEKGIVRYSKIGTATFRCARARPMVEEWLRIIESEPERWLPEEWTEAFGEGEAA